MPDGVSIHKRRAIKEKVHRRIARSTRVISAKSWLLLHPPRLFHLAARYSGLSHTPKPNDKEEVNRGCRNRQSKITNTVATRKDRRFASRRKIQSRLRDTPPERYLSSIDRARGNVYCIVLRWNVFLPLLSSFFSPFF